MRPMSKFEKLGVVAAVIVASSFIYMKKVYEPQEKRLKATVASLNKVVGEVNGLAAIKPSAALKSELARKKKELAAIESRAGMALLAGSERHTSELLSKISRSIDRCGLTVDSVKPGGKMPDELFQWNSYEFVLTGDYFQFMRFMDLLRAMPEAVKVKKIRMELVNDRTLRITMELLI